MKYTNVEYLDSLLACIAKASPSAGENGQEILNLAIKEAVISGYIKINPVTGTKSYKRTKPKIIIFSREKKEKEQMFRFYLYIFICLCYNF
ncbi:hypothetical protein DWV84_01730 [Blautia sp. AF13-16]|nr:hypothetical protein [Blautia parvula]POP36510.1 hypothetical protein C3R19_19585 [Blautia producta]RHP84232.1 hypothetical protein DXA40_01310 [Blautia sp. OF01-4LB]RHS21152.1 hypothetical protein DWV84_01730 [Blautia sp. AF13-16]